MSRVAAYLKQLPDFSYRTFATKYGISSHSIVQNIISSGNVPDAILIRIAERDAELAATLIELQKQDVLESTMRAARSRNIPSFPAGGVFLGRVGEGGLVSKILAAVQNTFGATAKRPALITYSHKTTIIEMPEPRFHLPSGSLTNVRSWPEALRSDLIRALEEAERGRDLVSLEPKNLDDLATVIGPRNAEFVAIDPREKLATSYAKEDADMPILNDDMDFVSTCPESTNRMLRICNDASPIDSISLLEVTFRARAKDVSPPKVSILVSVVSDQLGAMPERFSFDQLKQQVSRRSEDHRNQDINTIQNVETWPSAGLGMVFGLLPVYARYDVPSHRVFLLVYADHSTDHDVLFRQAIRREHEALCENICSEMKIPRT